MKTSLVVGVDYDPQYTDPEGLAVALDTLLDTVCSTPDILDDYNNPTFGPAFVLPPPVPIRIVITVREGVVQDIFSSNSDVRVALVDWDTEGGNLDNMVAVDDDCDFGHLYAYVAERPVTPLEELSGTATECVLAAADTTILSSTLATANYGFSEYGTTLFVLYYSDDGRLATVETYVNYGDAADALLDFPGATILAAHVC